MSDYFDSAKSEIDRLKKGALDAVAAAGTAGRRVYEDELTRIQEGKKQAIQAALADSARRGVPQALQDQLSQQIGSGYDRSISNMQSTRAFNEQSDAKLGAANAGYFDQAAAAIPAMKARADRQLEAIRAKAAQDEEERQMRLQLSQLQLQRSGLDYETAVERSSADRAERAAKAAGAARGDDLSDEELAKRLRGAADARVAASAHKPPKSIMGFKIPQMSQTQRARNIGVEAGIDPARVFGVTQPNKLPARKAAQRPSEMLQDREAEAQLARMDVYNTAKRAASSKTFFEFEKALNPDANGGRDPITYVKSLKDGYLKNAGISRTALLDWVQRYMAI